MACIGRIQMLDRQMWASFQTLFPVCSGTIAIIGCLTNVLSLSYFIKVARSTLTNKLFIALNVLDLLVSLLHVPIVTIWFCKFPLCGDEGPLFLPFLAVTENTVGCTAFVTCLLGVTRTISLLFPFYHVHKKGVGLAGLAFLAQEVVRTMCWFYAYYFRSQEELQSYISVHFSIMMALLTAVIFVNVASLVISAWKLSKDRNKFKISSAATGSQNPHTNNRRATVTILIVTVLFVVLNSLYCVTLFLVFHLKVDWNFILENIPMHVFHDFSIWLSVPLNSAINPLIYFARKREMRRYIRNIRFFS